MGDLDVAIGPKCKAIENFPGYKGDRIDCGGIIAPDDIVLVGIPWPPSHRSRRYYCARLRLCRRTAQRNSTNIGMTKCRERVIVQPLGSVQLVKTAQAGASQRKPVIGM